MATLHLPTRRLILAGGFAVAIAAAPAIAVFAVPTADTSVPVAQCPSGEEADTFTGVCVPHTVPNSPFHPIAGNPDLPAIGGIPCTGANTGECIGLAEEQQAQGPAPIPHSSVSSSP